MDKTIWNEMRQEIAGRPIRPITLALFTFDLGLVVASWLMRNSDYLALKLVSYPVLLLAIIHLYLILHEATHKLVSRNLGLNNGIGHFCGWFITLPFLPRQRNHLGHHAWTGHPYKDPENRNFIQTYSVASDEEMNKLDRIWKSWFPLIGINHIRGTWKNPWVLAKTDPDNPRYRQEKFWGKIYLVGYATVLGLLIYFGVLGLFVSWYLPAWFVFMMFIEMANLPHHAETPLLAEDATIPHPSTQDILSHNCAQVPIWSKYVMLNFNLHVYHHCFPQVPWYELKVIPDQVPSKSEIGWSLHNRKRSLVELMAQYFDKRGK